MCSVRICVHVVLKVDGGCQVVRGICGIRPRDDMLEKKKLHEMFQTVFPFGC